MKQIAFIIPYFGKLPDNYKLWLKSCEHNPTIDFIIITDDRTSYKVPSNVIVNYCSFEEIKEKIQKHFDFEVKVDRPWCLSLFKPAYGQIFHKELQKYDFWGYCDMDLMWGDIRKFITDDLLEKYERVGTKGHASIYRNEDTVNARYKTIASKTANYKTVFSGKSEYSFDENGMDEIYEYLNVPYYFRPYYAHLEKYEASFYLKRLPENQLYTNQYQVFCWNRGKLERVYLDGTNVFREEYMYIHFFCRPMKYIYGGDQCEQYIMYPDIVKPCAESITAQFIKKYGRQSKIKFWFKMFWYNKNKITIKKITRNFVNIKSYKRNK